MSQRKIDPKQVVREMLEAQQQRWVPVIAGQKMDTNSKTVPAQKALESTKPVLTANDRCDVRDCGAKAYVQAEFAWWADGNHVAVSQGSLYFCSHHFRVYEEGIREHSFAILDERWNIGG